MHQTEGKPGKSGGLGGPELTVSARKWVLDPCWQCVPPEASTVDVIQGKRTSINATLFYIITQGKSYFFMQLNSAEPYDLISCL